MRITVADAISPSYFVAIAAVVSDRLDDAAARARCDARPPFRWPHASGEPLLAIRVA